MKWIPPIKTPLLALTWITLSASVVLINKYILSLTSFRYVFFLAFLHMLVATAICEFVIALRPELNSTQVLATEVTWMRVRCCVVACLFSASLVASNAALARLDVSSVQMIKALNPAYIYFVGVAFGFEVLSCLTASSLGIVCGGVMFAVQGDLMFHALGVVLQASCSLMDSFRHLYLQSILQSDIDGINSFSMFRVVAPISALLLLAAGSIWEFPTMMFIASDVRVIVPLIIASSVLAFALNVCSYTYIKQTSALTMSVSGIFKDVILIGVSATYFGSTTNWKQYAGYAIATSGTMAYRFCRTWDKAK